MSDSALKYRYRSSWCNKTNSTGEITIDVVRSNVRYREVVQVRNALAYKLKMHGLSLYDIASIMNKSKSSIREMIPKADMRIVEKLEGFEL